MSPVVRNAVLMVTVAVLALAAGFGIGLLRGPTTTDGDTAAPLAHLLTQPVPDATGSPTDMSPYRGRVLVVNFWATWCPPCVQEMPDINEVQEEFRDKGVRVLGLGIDTPERIQAFGSKLTVDYPLFALDGGGLAVLKDFGNESGALPYTLVYDAAGREVFRKLGRVSHAELRQAVLDALAAPH